MAIPKTENHLDGDAVTNSGQPTPAAWNTRANGNPPPPRNFRWNNAQMSQSFSGLKKIARGRPDSLLEAACKVVNASFGGFGFLSAVGEMVENPAWGVPDSVAEELSRSPWLAELIRLVLQWGKPTRMADLERELRLARRRAACRPRDLCLPCR